MKHPARLTPAILVLALLAATPALPQAHRGAAPRSTSFGEALRGFLPDFMTRLWADLGCGVDPFGGCRPIAATAAGTQPPTPAWAEAGCGSDPFGGNCPRLTTSH